PKNKFSDLNQLNFTLHKNETLVQDGNTKAMLWKIDELIAYISQYFTLKTGDIIFTGTPEGVGKIEENDQLVGCIEGQEFFKINVK
ncbi:MAG TPA: fumarylacetoacetate hydrolase family protein, partial [Flavobacteriaceae bacterium]|nr:fumarylacetoacetate hydrolase family protein [Flavobacteriaceae bacterium]